MSGAVRFFFRRVLANLAFQWRVLRLVVDWVIAIYVVGPLIGIGIYHYILYLQQPPVWFSYVSFGMLRALLYLFVLNGTTRYFLEDGDQLHFLQGQRFADKFRRWGAAYSILLSGLQTAALFGLLYPLLHHEHALDGWTIAVLFGFVWSCKMLRQILQQMLDVTFVGWKLMLLNLTLLALLAYGFATGLSFAREHQEWGLGLSALIFLLLPVAYSLRFRVRGALAMDVRRDAKAKMKYVALILRDFVVKKPSYPRRRPFLFRNSGRLFRKRTPANGLSEAAIKVLFRSFTRMRLYMTIVLIFVGGVLFTRLTPADSYLFNILWVLSGFILCYFVKLQWADFADNSFFGLFAWKPEVLMQAMRTYMNVTIMPGFVLIGAAVWLPALPLLQALLMLPVGAFIGYLISSVYSTFAAFRMDKRGRIR